MVMALFVTGFGCVLLVMWNQVYGIPPFVGVGIAIVYLKIRNTYFRLCSKRSLSPNWFSKSVHCPGC